MYLEKIFKREDGTQYKIRAHVWIEFNTKADYDYEVTRCLPRKRTWYEVYDFDSNYEWRRMNRFERDNFRHKKYLEFVTASEVNETLEELWNNLRPTPQPNEF